MLQKKEDTSMGLSRRGLKCPRFELGGNIPGNAALELAD